MLLTPILLNCIFELHTKELALKRKFISNKNVKHKGKETRHEWGGGGVYP
jgi:hypothetical protein